MLDELKQLNERMYELYGRLYENEELLTKKQSDYMADKLFEAYKQAFGVLVLNAEPETAGAEFTAKERRKRLVPYVPRRLAKWLLRRRANEAALLLQREVREAVERDFAARSAKLDAAKREKPDAQHEDEEREDAAAPEQGAEHGEPDGAEEQAEGGQLPLIAENKPCAAQAEGRQTDVGAAGSCASTPRAAAAVGCAAHGAGGGM